MYPMGSRKMPNKDSNLGEPLFKKRLRFGIYKGLKLYPFGTNDTSNAVIPETIRFIEINLLR